MSAGGASELDDALAIARDVVADAAASLRGVRPSAVRGKSNPRDLVTEWDTRTEERIRAALARRTPDVPVVGEELGGEDATAGAARCWLLDPIDGTVNFAHGLPIWCISLALEGPGGIEVGVVAAPALGWEFWARRGGGAYRDGGERLAVSAIDRLDQALLVTGFPYDLATSPDNNLREWDHFQHRASAVRRLGAAAIDLCLVAAGGFDGYWEQKLQAWDLAAGALLVEEAGGRVTDTRGGRFDVRAGHVIASNGAIHDAIVGELASVRSAGT